MLFGRWVPSIIITLSMVSCWTGRQLDAPAWYKNSSPIDTSKLRFDGYYTNISEINYPQRKYTAVDPVFFTPKNTIYVSHGAHIISDSALFTCKFYKQLDPADLGVFIIEGNKVSAFVEVAVAMPGGWYGLYKLHFNGTIVNRELITNWKAVPPFPKKIDKRDEDNSQNWGIFKEHDLKFVRADSIRCLP